VHDALKRRALYHWVEHPGLEREIEIIRRRTDGVSAELAGQVARAVAQFRGLGLYKPPGVAESIDWAQALHRLQKKLTAESADASLGTVLKYREDQQRVRDHGLDEVVAAAGG
jgi:MoxR-like ATPase